MTIGESSLALEEIKSYVIELLRMELSSMRIFHNIQHTQNVVHAASLLTRHYKLPTDDEFTVLAAAWFHDTGYIDTGDNHEHHSALIAREFLTDLDIATNSIREINNLILSTRMPVNPANLLEKILCDADMQHLASPDYSDRATLLKNEIELYAEKKIPHGDWLRGNITFFERHHYYTDAAAELWNSGKALNYQKLRDSVRG